MLAKLWGVLYSEVDPAGDTTGYSYGTNQGNDVLRLDVTDNGQMECNSYYGPGELKQRPQILWAI